MSKGKRALTAGWCGLIFNTCAARFIR
jgi:hypothetical protein